MVGNHCRCPGCGECAASVAKRLSGRQGDRTTNKQRPTRNNSDPHKSCREREHNLSVTLHVVEAERDRYRAALETALCHLLERGFDRADVDALLCRHFIDPSDFDE